MSKLGLCCFTALLSTQTKTVSGLCWWIFSVAEGKTEWSRVYTRGGRAAVIELSWSSLLEGMLQEQEHSQKSEETYFTLLILSIVLNEGHFRARAHLCIVLCVLVVYSGQHPVVTDTESQKL